MLPFSNDSWITGGVTTTLRTAVAAVVLLTAARGYADGIEVVASVGGSPVTGGPAVAWHPDTESSPVMIVGMVEVGSPEDMLTWEVWLDVVPQGSATGTVDFSNAVLASPVPPNYVFAGRSSGYMSMFAGTPPDTFLQASDSDSDFTGVSVAPPRENLLRAEFTASPGAAGLFDVTMIPFDGEESGSNYFTANFDQLAFEGAAGPEPVVLATLQVGVPEPSTAILAVLALVSLAAARRYPRLRRWDW